MINFAKQSAQNRRAAFAIVSEQMRMNEGIVEKDFYVVLLLEILFKHSSYGNHFAFKGGTSLSKAYNIIKRFSEDIDVVMDWRLLGLTDGEVWQQRSNRQQLIFNKTINRLAADWINEVLVLDLKKTLDKLDLKDFNVLTRSNDRQTIIIEYPREFETAGILSEIRLEIGPLAAWTPMTDKKITSYIAELFPQSFSQPSSDIPTVAARRTFWEKATILHKEAHRISNKIPRRYSRHYYDLFLLSQSFVKREALSDLELLQRVVNFTQKFYPSNAAKYNEAVPETLKLLPKKEQLDDLYTDYQNMQAMIFEKAPSFAEVMRGIEKLQREINTL